MDATKDRPAERRVYANASSFIALAWEVEGVIDAMVTAQMRDDLPGAFEAQADLTEILRTLDFDGFSCALALLSVMRRHEGLYTRFNEDAEGRCPISFAWAGFADALIDNPLLPQLFRLAEVSGNVEDCVAILEHVRTDAGFEALATFMGAVTNPGLVDVTMRFLIERPLLRPLDTELEQVRARWQDTQHWQTLIRRWQQLRLMSSV